MCGTIIGVNIKMTKKYYDEKDIIKGLKFAKRMNEFVSYVYDFYGKNGIYDMGATVSEIQTATIDYIIIILCFKNNVKSFFNYYDQSSFLTFLCFFLCCLFQTSS